MFRGRRADRQVGRIRREGRIHLVREAQNHREQAAQNHRDHPVRLHREVERIGIPGQTDARGEATLLKSADSIKSAQQILELLQQMNERYGLTTIIVTHDPHIARAVNRVVTIRDGRISSETIRREDDVASALTAGITATHAQHVFEEYLVVDEGGHLQLPHDLAERARIGDRVTLELKEDGLLIKPVAGRSTVAAPLIAISEDEPPAKRKAWWKRGKK